jgi:hypothetical protein
MMSGSCQCGTVRFETTGKPRFVANCHCQDCRHATGAAYSTWVGFPDRQVNWTGQRASFASSPGVRRSFCRKCGSPLSYQGKKWPGETHILIGAFDTPDAYAPAGDVFTDEALAFAKPSP